MIKLEHEVFPSPDQMEFIIEGMRNPKNSWKNSDSKFVYENGDEFSMPSDYDIGPKDYDLMHGLAIAGTEHRKYLRMMNAYVRITAPLYWWKEFDTYKIGTVANSCSTMHKIAEKPFTVEDFSTEHLLDDYTDEKVYSYGPDCEGWDATDLIHVTVDILNAYRNKYLVALKTEEETNLPAKDIWWQLIQLLPSSYNQTRNVMISYETLANIYRQRKNHKLDEWHEFCNWIKHIPYSTFIMR